MNKYTLFGIRISGFCGFNLGRIILSRVMVLKVMLSRKFGVYLVTIFFRVEAILLQRKLVYGKHKLKDIKSGFVRSISRRDLLRFNFLIDKVKGIGVI